MIFQDKMDEIGNKLMPEIDRLFDLALKNQKHTGDLLLWLENGFYYPDIPDVGEKKFNPYVIGQSPPRMEKSSEITHNDFIYKYRKNICPIPFSEYLELLNRMLKKTEARNNLIESEATSIQLEMLIYLKFWEADLIIKRLYQFARILSGEPYDWHFKIKVYDKDEGTGMRQEIIREHIRDKVKDISPIIYDLIKSTYKTQIRNAIAHSQYYFAGNRNFGLNNYNENEYSKQRCLEFNEWVDMFHNTLILHNEYSRLKVKINDHYAKLALKNNNLVKILVTEKDGYQYPLLLKYRQEFHDWHYAEEQPCLAVNPNAIHLCR
jgi:hypothetical protein